MLCLGFFCRIDENFRNISGCSYNLLNKLSIFSQLLHIIGKVLHVDTPYVKHFSTIDKTREVISGSNGFRGG
jgi:hypothetical protein